jgi:hypothetical protein
LHAARPANARGRSNGALCLLGGRMPRELQGAGARTIAIIVEHFGGASFDGPRITAR